MTSPGEVSVMPLKGPCLRSGCLWHHSSFESPGPVAFAMFQFEVQISVSSHQSGCRNPMRSRLLSVRDCENKQKKPFICPISTFFDTPSSLPPPESCMVVEGVWEEDSMRGGKGRQHEGSERQPEGMGRQHEGIGRQH